MIKSLRKVLAGHCVADAKYLSILCICMICLVFKGCIPENIVLPGTALDSPSDSISSSISPLVSVPNTFVNYFETGISFGNAADEVEIVFKVDVDWMMKIDGSDASWCSLDSDLGSAGLHKIKVRAEKNVDYELRRADILLLALDNTKLAEVVVTQDSRKGFLLSLEDTTISFMATTIEVPLESNVDVECEVMDADWVRKLPQKSRGLTACAFVFEVANNISHESRVAHIRFYNSEQSIADTLTIFQEGILVDLGLSVKWANCNVGATAPEDYGGYYAWGDTEVKSNYISSSSTANGLSISELQSQGIIGPDGNLTAAYDAATVNWGDDWRMPTSEEVEELIDDCTWSWTTQNGVKGYKVTGPNGNSIFLPAAGYRYGSSFSNVDSYGYYWSSVPDSDSRDAYSLCFDSDNAGWDDNYRFYGYPIRSVWGEREIIVTTGEVTDITTNGAKLSGTVYTSQPLTCGIIYGTSSSLSSTDGTMVSTTSSENFSVSISGLTANTTYYYRAYVIDNGVYKYGDVRSFSTKKSITVTTGDATNITASEATLSGTIVDAEQSHACGIIYGTFSSLSSTNGTKKSATSSGNFSVSISGLTANTTYYYRAYVIGNGEDKYGEILSFTTGYITTVGEAIDLGLSVKWASWNVGATAPEEYGSCFAWGETGTKSNYTESNSVTYGLSISELESRGIIGSDGQLTASYDAATVNWGSDWRMPTKDEVRELLDKCTSSWTTQNGVNGYKVIGPNGNFIFLPVAGYRYGTEILRRGSIGKFWSGSPIVTDNDRAYALLFDNSKVWWGINQNGRYNGLPVRPVTNQKSSNNDVDLDGYPEDEIWDARRRR